MVIDFDKVTVTRGYTPELPSKVTIPHEYPEEEGYIVIPDKVHEIEAMMEQGHWDRKTYNRMIMKKHRLLRKEFGPKTARQETLGYIRGRLPNDQADKIKVKQIAKDLINFVTKGGEK
jgi:hypothetical protein